MSRGWQAGWQPGWESGPPPGVQAWWWGPSPQQPSTEVAPSTPVRIGDAERDSAVSDLGDHFAAGRLTREEFDERADQAMQARFSTDLDPLFADLPRPGVGQQPPPSPGGPRPPFGPPPIVLWLLPVLLVGAIAGAILLHAPFLVWLLVWFVVIGKITSHRRRYRRQQLHQGHRQQPYR